MVPAPTPADLRAHAAKLIAVASQLDAAARTVPSLAAEAERCRAQAAALDVAAENLAIAQQRASQALSEIAGKTRSRVTVQKPARPVKGKRTMSTAKHAYDRSAAMSAVAKGRRVNPDHKIYAWLESRGETLTEWAKAKGYSRALVAYWVNGQRRIPTEIAEQIARDSDGAVPVEAWPKRR